MPELGGKKCIIPKCISANIVLKYNSYVVRVKNTCPQTDISSVLNAGFHVSVAQPHQYFRWHGYKLKDDCGGSASPSGLETRECAAHSRSLAVYAVHTLLLCCCSCTSFCRPIIIIYPVWEYVRILLMSTCIVLVLFFLSFHYAHYSSMHYFSCVRQCYVQSSLLTCYRSRTESFLKYVLFSVPIESPLHRAHRLTGWAVLWNFNFTNIYMNLSHCSKHNSELERKKL